MFDDIEEYEEELERHKRRYNPRGGAIHPEKTYDERNRVSGIKPKRFWEV